MTHATTTWSKAKERTTATPLVKELPWHAATHEWNMVERNADRRSNPLFARHCFFRFWANIQFKVHEVSRNLLHRQIGLVPEVSEHGLSRQDATRDHLRKDSQQGLGECILLGTHGAWFSGAGGKKASDLPASHAFARIGY